jgi:hypothetical protein
MPGEVITAYGYQFARRKDVQLKPEFAHLVGWNLLPVRPLRERCRYYKRQVFPFQAEDTPSVGRGMTEVARNCTIRRSIGGAFLSLKNEGVYACDYRDPPDPETTKRFLDDPQRKKLDDNAHLTKVPAFGMS